MNPLPDSTGASGVGRTRRQNAGIAYALGRRLAVAVATVVAVSVLVFAAIEIVPVDPALHALGRDSTPEQRQVFRQRMHLDDPAPQRYLRWAGQMAQGNFGTSVISGRAIGPLLSKRLKYTVILGALSLGLSIVIGLPLSIWAARRRDSAPDLGLSIAAISLTSVPEFVLALVVLLIGASWLHWFPVTSGGVVKGEWNALVLPVVTLALGATAYVFRLARVSILEAMSAPYVRTAVLNGFTPNRILWRHVLPNASAVIVNVVALNAIFLLSGVIVIENVYAYPGIGTLLVQSIESKDLPIIEAVSVVTAAMLVTINLIADGVVLLAVPRLRARAARGRRQ